MSDDHSSNMITQVAHSLSRSHENLKSLSASLDTSDNSPSSLDDLHLTRSEFVTIVNLAALSITSKRRRIPSPATKTTTSVLDDHHRSVGTLDNTAANTFYDSPSSESSSASSSDDESEDSSEDFDDRDSERIAQSPSSCAFQHKARDADEPSQPIGTFFIGRTSSSFDDDEDTEQEDGYDDEEEEDDDDWEPSRILYTGGSALTPCMSRASMECEDGGRAKPPPRVGSFDWDSNVRRSADSDWDSTCGDDVPDEMDSEDFPTLHTWPHSWIWNPPQHDLPSIQFHYEESNPPDQFSWTPLQDSKYGCALTVPGYYAYNVRHPPMVLQPTEDEEEELCFSIEEAAIIASTSELEDQSPESFSLPSVSSMTLMAPPMYTCGWDTPYSYDSKSGHTVTRVFSLEEQATETIYSAPASSGSGGTCRWNKIRNARRSLSTSRSPSPIRQQQQEVQEEEDPLKAIGCNIQVSPPMIDDENGQSSLAMSLPPMPIVRPPPPPPPPTRTMSEPAYEPVERGRTITRRMSVPVVTRSGKF